MWYLLLWLVTIPSTSTHILPAVRIKLENGSCPYEAKMMARNVLQVEAATLTFLLRELGLEFGPWHRVAHFNMSDPDQNCSPNWRLINAPVRACGAVSGESCSSAVFPSNGESYSRVCGRVIGYQKGMTDAFYPSVDGCN